MNDELGTPVGIIDNIRNIHKQDFDTFGISKNSSDFFGFTGYQNDETGLMYGQARYYSPEIGRFISEDSYKGNAINVQSLNLSIYCSNNPLKFIDPNGHVSCKEYEINDDNLYPWYQQLWNRITIPAGKQIQMEFHVQEIVDGQTEGHTAKGHLIFENKITGKTIKINEVYSGGLSIGEPIPFGDYSILKSTHGNDILYHRLEAQDSHFGDDIINFEGQTEHSNVRLHERGSGLTFGCISIPDDDVENGSIILDELNNVDAKLVHVDLFASKNSIINFLFKEEQKQFGEMHVIDDR